MELNKKLEALQKQAKELETMYIKVQGAIELVKGMMEEEKPSDDKKDKKEK